MRNANRALGTAAVALCVSGCTLGCVLFALSLQQLLSGAGALRFATLLGGGSLAEEKLGNTALIGLVGIGFSAIEIATNVVIGCLIRRTNRARKER